MCLAVPGRIVSIWDEGGATMADAEFAGEHRRVCLDYFPGLAVGDHVIVHAGYALTRVDPTEAERTLALMQEFGLLEEVEGS
jgi:hydrogenase expression/formation protein HypC